MNYFLQIRIKDTACPKNCDNEICNIAVYVRPWENYRELTNFTCRKIVANKPQSVSQKKTQTISQKPLGAMMQIENDNSEALKALDFGIKSLNEKSNDLFTQKLVKVDKIFRQVVAGMNYAFEFTMGRSNCTKVTGVNSANCFVGQSSKLSQCKINVWDQPWIEESRYKLTRSDC
jgi:hypothetical protein